MADFDYSEFEDKQVGSNVLQQLSQTALELKQAEAEVARLEEELQEAKGRVRHLSEHALPELMDACEVEKFTTRDGIEISVAEKIRATIPAARHREAMEWLEEHGASDLVKRQFIIEFGREDTAWAKKFESDLKRRKVQLPTKQKETVHPQTLAKFIKDQLEAGTAVPLDVFGAFRQRYTRIKV